MTTTTMARIRQRLTQAALDETRPMLGWALNLAEIGSTVREGVAEEEKILADMASLRERLLAVRGRVAEHVMADWSADEIEAARAEWQA